MNEHKGDLFEKIFEPYHQVAISTNGTIKRDGQGVMGRGCARDAVLMYPEFPRVLGNYLRDKGNIPGYVTVGDGSGGGKRFLILPVKHNWWERASLELVTLSRNFLRDEAIAHPEVTFHVPRLGCGNGRLSWPSEVEPEMRFLPQNVVVHH